ncbi:MAG: methionyl aminopeptidase [Candidatus Dependentiae bacterium]|nr:methionyl aminopeptidase [Candidatus Dependentiae bacterium]
MIMIKNKAALAKMRDAGQKLAQVMHDTLPTVVSGMTTAALDAEVEARMRALGLHPACKGFKGYRHASCISVNDIVVHGVPSPNVQLKAGDCVTIDIVGISQGYHADMARTLIVPGSVEPAPEVVRLIAVAEQSLKRAQEVAGPGIRLGVVSRAIQQVIEAAGFGVLRDFVGHGIGRQMHEDPQVPNFDTGDEGPLLRPGMTLAIEPMITIGAPEVIILPDRWSVQTRDRSWSAHVENTVAITENGLEILTQIR